MREALSPKERRKALLQKMNEKKILNKRKYESEDFISLNDLKLEFTQGTLECFKNKQGGFYDE